MKFIYSLPLLLLWILSSCSSHQREGHRVVKLASASGSANNELNFLYSQQVYGGAYNRDPKLLTYVNLLGKKIALSANQNPSHYHFVITNSSIPNVWSFPKGNIAITRGLLAELKNEAELVAVLAHEIAHISRTHGKVCIDREVILNAGPVTLDKKSNYFSYDLSIGPLGSGMGLITLKYDDKAEMEADSDSIQRLQKMGYSPQAYIHFQNRLIDYRNKKDSNWMGGFLAKHPINEELINQGNPSKSFNNGDFAQKGFENYVAFLKSQNETYKKLDEGYRNLLSKKYHEVLEITEKEISSGTGESHFYLLKGKALVLLDRSGEALFAFDKAVEINPYYFDNYLQRGLLKEEQNDFESATSDLQKSLRLLPTAEAYYALGEIDYRNDLTNQAFENFRKAGISGSPGGKKALERLHGLKKAFEGLHGIVIEPYFAPSGYLELQIQNTGSKEVKNLVINVEELDAGGSLIYRHLIEVKEPLSPQKELKKKTSVGPFFDKHHMLKSLSISPVYSD